MYTVYNLLSSQISPLADWNIVAIDPVKEPSVWISGRNAPNRGTGTGTQWQ